VNRARSASREPRVTRAKLACAAAAAIFCLAGAGGAGANPLKSRAKPPAPASSTLETRASLPVVTAMGPAAGQAGTVHYFLLRFPDDALEIQIGIELDDQRIAWSFPGLGAVASPFIREGVMPAGGQDVEVWHLYGIRPFPSEAGTRSLQRALPGRIRPWLEARAPYCEHEVPGGGCMSCLGFVMRALFPAGRDGELIVPRDFWRAGLASRYTTHDLLLYLTGMLDLPTREARLQRLERLTLPADLREDLDELLHAMGPAEAPDALPPITAPRKVSSKPLPKKRL